MKKLYIVALAIILTGSAFAEEMTFSTYYPAPYGVYREMRAKRMAIGNTYYDGGTYSWDGGTIDANADLIVEGNVGIGTTNPSTGDQSLALDIEGAVGATYYCDQDGNSCVSSDSLGPPPSFDFITIGQAGIYLTNNASTSATCSAFGTSFTGRARNNGGTLQTSCSAT